MILEIVQKIGFQRKFQSAEKLKKSIVVVSFAAALIIASVVIGYSYLQGITNNEDDPYKVWISSGPFHIREAEYLLGENIFISVGELAPHESGNLLIFLPNGTFYRSFPFDGKDKSSFNVYFTPDLSRLLGICVVEELIGTWKLVFEGTEYKEITFEVIEEYQLGEKEDYEPVC